MQSRQQTSAPRRVLRGFIFIFPGGTFFLTVFSLFAYGSTDTGLWPYAFSAFAFYFLFYTLAQRLPLYAGAVIAPLATLMFCMAIFFHNETGSLLPGDALVSDLWVYTETAVPSGLLRSPLILTAIYPLLLVAYFALQARLMRFRRGYNLDHHAVKAGALLALVVLFFLPPAHFPYLLGTAYRSFRLKNDIQKIEIAKAGKTLAPLFAAPRTQYPLADYPFLRLPPSLSTEEEMSVEAFTSAWEEDRLKTTQAGTPPNLFLILLDDFNGLMRGERAEGRALTPVLDGLYERGLGADRFYASGPGHLRGPFAILCGVHASFLAPASILRPDNNSFCLPRILNYAGYSTYYLNDSARANLHNAQVLMKRIGFEQVFSNIGKDAEKTNPDRVLSWSGDAEYYRNVFRFLNERGATEQVFVTIAVHEHTYPFVAANGDSFRSSLSPDRKRALYQESLSRADAALAVFFQELEASPFAKNSIIAIVGAQGYPAGEHGVFHDERGAYEEHFRTVFALTGARAAGRVTVPVGQTDVGPTLLDVLGVSAPNHFLGRSLLDSLPTARPIYFSQAADGKYLGYVSYPYRYVYHLGGERETIYNLAEDPGEKQPLDPVANKNLYETMRKRRGLLPLNQAVLLENRLWPLAE